MRCEHRTDGVRCHATGAQVDPATRRCEAHGGNTRGATWLYRQTETASEAPPHGLYTVGFHDPAGKWVAESDHNTPEAAAARVHFLNGGGGHHA